MHVWVTLDLSAGQLTRLGTPTPAVQPIGALPELPAAINRKRWRKVLSPKHKLAQQVFKREKHWTRKKKRWNTLNVLSTPPTTRRTTETVVLSWTDTLKGQWCGQSDTPPLPSLRARSPAHSLRAPRWWRDGERSAPGAWRTTRWVYRPSPRLTQLSWRGSGRTRSDRGSWKPPGGLPPPCSSSPRVTRRRSSVSPARSHLEPLRACWDVSLASTGGLWGAKSCLKMIKSSHC